jgi:hypothetical protein
MVLPDSSLYKDFNSETDFVDLKMENIEVYLKLMERTIDSNAKKLYKEMFLKYIRLAKFNNDFYVKTECRAPFLTVKGRLLALIDEPL